MAWLFLALLSAGMAAQAYLDPSPSKTVPAVKRAETGHAAAPSLQKEIATLSAQSQRLARRQQETQLRLAALEEQLSSITGSLPAAPPVPQGPKIMSTEFGVEIASATDIGEIDAIWQAMRQLHSADLAALSPAIRVAGAAQSRELVLIAGPLANARDAARICAVLRDAGQTCREVPFAGDMIRLRDNPRGKAEN